MPHPTKTFAASFFATGLITLLTMPDAMAQERITLETIGAVRMARFDEVRGANPELRSAQAAPARAAAARPAGKAR